MLVRLLARGHLRSRFRRYLLLAVAIGLALEGFFCVLMVLDGAETSLVDPLRATLVGPMRVTQNTSDLGAGRTWMDFRPAQSQLARISGGVVVERFESNYITVRGQDYDNWSAGLLVGIDPVRDPLVANHSRFIVWGHPLEGDFEYAPDGHGYAPLVLGKAAVKRLNLTLPQDGRPDFGRILTLTSGHTASTGVPLPVTLECVLVGVFQTGLDPLDKFSAFMPITHARFLAGFAENDPVANSFLVDAPGGADLASRIQTETGFKAQTAQQSAFSYMGSMLVVLYAAAALGVALFLGALIVWLVHDTGTFLRQDQAVLSSLRAIGVPTGPIAGAYVGLTAFAVTAGAVAALLVGVAMAPFVPPISWHLSGLKAQIPLEPHVGWMLALSAIAVFASVLAAWATARRVMRLNIVDGLRRT